MPTKIALAQIDPVLGDVAANVDKHVAASDEAARRGAGLIVFPELSLTGYSVRDMNWDLAMNPSQPPDVLLPLLERSRTISILAGGIEEGEDHAIFNSALFFENGTVRSVHRKTYPPTYGMFEEMRYFSRGNSIAAFDCKHGRLGALICEDLWHLSVPYVLAQDGAQVIIALVASPTRVSGEEGDLEIASVNAENHRSFARLLSTYLVFCNRVGYEDGVNFWGRSSVVSPSGETLVSAKLMEEDLVMADLTDDAIRRARRFSRHALDEDNRLVLKELLRISRNTK